MLTEAQLLARKAGLGGSDTATILNLNPYKSGYELWQEKSGRVEPEDISGKFAIRRGNDMEALVVKWFEEETGLQTEQVEATLSNPDFPFMLAHIDGKILGVDEGLEAKTANWRMAAKFGDGLDDVPASYLIQCMHYMIVTGYRVWHLAADVGGDFKIYRIEYDEVLANHIATTVNEWWTTHIVNDIEPTPVTGREIDVAYPSADPDDCMEASQSIADIHAELKLVNTELKALKEKDAGLRDQIKGAMGTASAMTFDGAKLASWGNQTRSSFDSKAFKLDEPDLFEQYKKTSEFRVFRPNLK